MANTDDFPPLCANGCGFYGSLKTKNLCSKCYNESLKQMISKSEPQPKRQKLTDTSTESNSFTDDSVDPSFSVSNPPKQKNRCQSCNKKVGLMGFSCRCGSLFCGVHRYPNEHSCKFDYKTADRLILAKDNPLIKADKLKSKV